MQVNCYQDQPVTTHMRPAVKRNPENNKQQADKGRHGERIYYIK